MRYNVKKIVLISLLVPTLTLLLLYILPYPTELNNQTDIQSIRITDRNGVPLRDLLSSDEGRSKSVTINEISPNLINATLIAEDKRFYIHPGVDPIAITRAAITNFREKRIVSGGSTLTQQLVRIVKPRKRTLLTKIGEALTAIRVEISFSKKEILEQYLNRAPYGNQLFGIEAASQMYFEKPARDLSIAESAFLAILPRAPSAYDPYKDPEKIKIIHENLIADMLEAEKISEEEFEMATKTPLKLIPKRWTFRAPHFVEMLPRLSTDRIIKTSLDIKLQNKIEHIVDANIEILKKYNVTNAAVVVIENKTGEILALIGSRNYHNESISGNVNGAISLRQPGSALKPFTYALALDNGFTAASIIPDIEMQFPTDKGDYIPRNYDRKFRGPVRLRIALSNSLNVPAVYLVSKLGTENLLAKLHELGFESLNKDSNYYGLGITLGNGEVKLLELAAAYSSLARGGLYVEPSFLSSCRGGPPCPPSNQQSLAGTETGHYIKAKRVFSSETSYLISDILSDYSSRRMTFGHNSPLNLPFKVAAKTGTSKNFRDNWTVGYTPEITVGVWVGNFDASPMRGITGITGAGPIFREVFLAAAKSEKMTWFKKPNNIVQKDVCPLSGMIVDKHCTNSIEEIFTERSLPKDYCEFHDEEYLNLPSEYEEWAEENNINLAPKRHYVHETNKPKKEQFKITHPRNNSTYFIDPSIPRRLQTLSLKASSDKSADWFIDGKKLNTNEWPLTEGRHKITIASKDGSQRDEIEIRVFK